MTNSDSGRMMENACGHKDEDREKLSAIYAGLIRAIGLTGREIAKLSGTRPQYISDIKRRQRPLSHDMFMRTLVGLYGPYRWLISGDPVQDTERIIALYPYLSQPESAVYPLPVFQRPFMGPKMTAGDWDGSFLCVASPVKELAREMHEPYVLHLPFDDKFGRLRRGDYLLVNQTAVDSPTGYVLIKSGWGVKLVRRNGESFVDVENGEPRLDRDGQIIGSIAMLLMGGI